MLKMGACFNVLIQEACELLSISMKLHKRKGMPLVAANTQIRKMSENGVKFPEMSSDVLFCLTNGSKLKNIHFTTIED